MQNRRLGIGLSPIGSEGFAHPSARPKRSKTKLVLQSFPSLLICTVYNIPPRSEHIMTPDKWMVGTKKKRTDRFGFEWILISKRMVFGTRGFCVGIGT